MKRLLTALMVLLLGLGLSTCIHTTEPPEPDWLSMLVRAAEEGDREAGLAAVEGWNADETRPSLDYDLLLLLSDFLAAETDSRWLTDELRLGKGEVALNRVASPEFPDTLEEVLPGYAEELKIDCDRAEGIDRGYTELALRLLLGERRLEKTVVYLGPMVRGPVHSVFKDLHYGSFYFCESNHPELYAPLAQLGPALLRMLPAIPAEIGAEAKDP